MKITRIGIDLAKEDFHIYDEDARGNAVLCKQLRWRDMAQYFTKLEPW